MYEIKHERMSQINFSLCFHTTYYHSNSTSISVNWSQWLFSLEEMFTLTPPSTSKNLVGCIFIGILISPRGENLKWWKCFNGLCFMKKALKSFHASFEFDATQQRILHCDNELKKTKKFHLKFLMRWHAMIFNSILASVYPIHALCIMISEFLLKMVCVWTVSVDVRVN